MFSDLNFDIFIVTLKRYFTCLSINSSTHRTMSIKTRSIIARRILYCFKYILELS